MSIYPNNIQRSYYWGRREDLLLERPLAVSAMLNIRLCFGKLILAVMRNMEPRGKAKNKENSCNHTVTLTKAPSCWMFSMCQLFTHISLFVTSIFQSSIRVQILAKHLFRHWFVRWLKIAIVISYYFIDGNLGWGQEGKLSFHIVMYSAVRWACLKCSKQLHSHVWSLGLVGTVARQPTCSLSRTAASEQQDVLHSSSALREREREGAGRRERDPRSRKWKLSLSWGLESETGTAALLPYSIGQSVPKPAQIQGEGAKMPLHNGRRVEVFASHL